MSAGNVFDRYNNYRFGVPLNAELAAVANGQVSFLDEAAAPPPAAPSSSTEVAQRQITHAERVMLRELRSHEGWPVLMQVLGKKLDGIRKNTISKSQNDPLKHRDEIAESWALLQLAERFVESLPAIVGNELSELEKEEKAKQ